jgi:predicted transcriptional regulator
MSAVLDQERVYAPRTRERRRKQLYKSNLSLFLEVAGMRDVDFIRATNISEATFYAYESGRRSPTGAFRKLAAMILANFDQDEADRIEPLLFVPIIRPDDD